MLTKSHKIIRLACFCYYPFLSPAFVLPSMLFLTFHEMYNISYTLLGTLVLISFCTQLLIDVIFAVFEKHFNIVLTVRIMPIVASLGLLIYALIPMLLPQYAFLGIVLGTFLFAIAAGLGEVLISPIITSLPSVDTERDLSFLHSLYGWGVVGAVLISSLYFFIFGTENWAYLVLAFSLFPIILSFLFCFSDIPLQNGDKSERRKNKNKKALILFAICIFLGSAAENTMTNWISGYMETALQVPKMLGDVLGLAVFAFLLAMVRVLYSKFTPNISKTLLVGMIGAAICYIVTALSDNLILSFTSAILIGLFSSMLWPGTLILMEEKIKSPGVAAYALMAAGGDLGASVGPQLLGIVVDKVSASPFATSVSQNIGISTEELGMKVGMLISALFPIAGTILIIYFIKGLSFIVKREG